MSDLTSSPLTEDEAHNAQALRLRETFEQAVASGTYGQYSFLGIAEAFLIFAKYSNNKGWEMMSAEHDEIWAGPDPTIVSAEDIARLEELGWTDEDGTGFHRFV